RTHTWRSPLLRRSRSLNDVSPMSPAPALIPPATTRIPGLRTACLLLALVCLNGAPPAIAQSPTLQTPTGLEPITPIPAMPAQHPRHLFVGDRLFRDRRLSHDDTRSCSSCHHIRTNGANANAPDLSPDGSPLALNSPTLFSGSLNLRLNWERNFPPL